MSAQFFFPPSGKKKTKHFFSEREVGSALCHPVKKKLSAFDYGLGYKKCPSMFFILSEYIEHVYNTYIDTKKLSPRFLWVSKFDVKLGMGEHHFRNYPMYVIFKYLVPNLSFLISMIAGVLKNHPFFRKSQKPFLPFKIENI